MYWGDYMKYYISCAAADHGKIKALHTELDRIGHTCIYDWQDDTAVRGKEDFEIAFNRVQAIESAELFLCLLPATRNTAIEFGIAIASRYGKRIILWSPTGTEFDSRYANTYFKHPSVSTVTCSFQELLEYVNTL